MVIRQAAAQFRSAQFPAAQLPSMQLRSKRFPWTQLATRAVPQTAAHDGRSEGTSTACSRNRRLLLIAGRAGSGSAPEIFPARGRS